MKLIDQSWEWMQKPPKNTLELIEKAGRTCLSEDTDILTENGWKNVKEVHEGEYVLTCNYKNKVLEYEKSNMFCKEFDGNMIEANHRLSSFFVTDDHRMFAKKNKDSEYGFVLAKDLLDAKYGHILPSHFDFGTNNKDCKVKIKMKDHFYSSGRPYHGMMVPGKVFDINDDFITIMGAYICDGHLLHENKGICITKTIDSPLYKRVVKSLDNLGWSYSVSDSAGRKHIKSIIINGGKPIGRWFEDNCGRGSLKKVIPHFFREFSHSQLLLLLDVMFDGDGDKNTNMYKTSSKRLANQIQEIYVLVGGSGTIFNHPISGWTKNPHYIVRAKKRPFLIMKPNQLTVKKVKSTVYCPQTDNGIICIRRGGHTLWIGNCYKSESKITDESSSKFVEMLLTNGHHSVIEHCIASVKLITSRSVTHELVRHRLCAFSQESQRYVKYNDIEFITPVWWNEIGVLQKEDFKCAMIDAEESYNIMIESGLRPEQSREVLPNATKTEIVMTANLREWRHVLSLRCSKKAHPQIRDLMISILIGFKSEVPVLFDDLYAKYC